MSFHTKRYFSIAAYLNYVIGMVFLTTLPEVASEINLPPLLGGAASLRFCGVLVSAWGCGYWLISRELLPNKSVMRAISICKWMLALVFVAGLMRGDFYWPIPLLIFVDLVSIEVFLNCLRRLVLPIAGRAMRI